MASRALLTDIAKQFARLPDRLAHALVLTDVNRWLRVEFLGIACRTGLADELGRWSTAEQLAVAIGGTDTELLKALLEVGVSLGEVAKRGRVYRAEGRRLRAAAGRSDDMRGLLEEVVVYDSPIYTNLGRHLQGAPPADYLAGVGDVIARSSRVAEPVLGPIVRSVTGRVAPRRVLDVGCGTGAYLRHVLATVPTATAVGIDLDAGAIEAAQRYLRSEVTAGRCELHVMDLDTAAGGALGTFELVLLLNSIYYRSPEQRPDLLRQLRSLVPGGHVIAASAIANRAPLNRNLDLVVRVTRGAWRLPTKAELADALRQAGYADIDLVEPISRIGLIAAVGHNPDAAGPAAS